MSGDRDPEVWERIDTLFSRALELPPDQRRSFLDEACEGEPEVRRAVEELLETDEAAEAAGFLARSAEVTWEDVWDEAARESGLFGGGEPGDRRGERLGAYELEEEIGRGGMATVYRARRVDGAFEQEVAIKIVRPSLAADRMIRRLRAEREILSSLSHPGIARILDGGTTEDGLPYLVMEHVEGHPVTAYCDGRPLEERLEVFLQVADAVQHAHRSLVLHRDLKPSNILVTDQTRVRLLDFGIAKLLDPEASGAEATLTVGESGPLTPDFASPEQIRGEAVTTASDVYQLGVLLYRILAGQRPYRLEGGNPVALAREIEEVELRPPSQRVEQGRGVEARRLRGDLDTIVLKAMREEPGDRYASVEAMAEDVRRHLEGRPIRARPARWTYKLRKFAGRNRWFGPVAAALVLVVGGYVWTLQRHAAELERERDVARAEAAKAAQVRDFLITVFEGSDPEETLGDTVTARELLQRGAAHVDSALADQPELQAEMLGVIGRVSANLGFYDRAIPLLERAATMRRELEPAHSREVAEAVSSLAMAVKENIGPDTAIPLYREVVSHLRRGDPVDTIRLAGALSDLGDSFRIADRPDSAETALREALALMESQGEEGSDKHLKVLSKLGPVLRAQEKYGEAETLYRRVLRGQRQVLEPGDPALAPTLNNLAYVLTLQDKHQEAAELYRESLALVTGVYGPGHPHTARVRMNLASTLIYQGDVEGALALARENVRALEKRWSEGHWRLARAHSRLGKFLVTHEGPEAALPPLETAARIYTEELGPEHLWTTMSRAWLNATRLLSGETPAGSTLERLRVRLLTRLEEGEPGAAALVPSSARHLAEVLADRDHPDEARAWRKLAADP